ncbi:MAG: Zn-dependent oxidoreductase, partial [Thermoprotei archaeon]
MRRMKAAVLEAPKRLVLKDVPVPSPRTDEVLIKVGACGICGRDVRYYFGENPWALHT